VGPWEWEQHPEWLQRLQTRLIAEDEGREIRRKNAEDAAKQEQTT